MRGNFDECLALVLRHEGGYVDHPRDPGGATNKGITLATLAAYRGQPVTKADVKALGLDEVAAIYRRNYWARIGGDALPSGLDYALFDLAVNSGVGKATRYRDATTGAPADRIRAVCTRRLAFLKALPTWKTFGKGWQRRVEEVQRHALEMARQAQS